MFRKRNKKKRLRKISTKKRYPTRVGETTEPGSVHVLLFDIGNRPFSSSDGLFCRVLVAYFSHTFYVPRLFLRINRDKSGPLRASNPVFPTHFNAFDLRFDLKLFRVYSQNMDTPKSVTGFFFLPKTLARLVLLNEVLTLDSLLISFTTI